MRYLFIAVVASIIFMSCKKTDGNSAPQIKFKSILGIYFSNVIVDAQPLPILTIQVLDDDGDLGFKDGKDTSYIYIKNITIPPFRIDSFKFPSELSTLPTNSFRSYVDVDIDLSKSTAALISRLPGTNRRDSLFYEVYIKDFKKNKSNVVKTDKPLVFITP